MIDRPVLFFDGVCNLCNRAVQFVIRHDKKGQFLFAPLQGKAGAEALTKILRQPKAGSVILWYKGKYYTRSAAALHTLQLLGGGWYPLSWLLVIPAPVRDVVYDLVARNRYRWFGKQDSCMVPTPELTSRFLP